VSSRAITVSSDNEKGSAVPDRISVGAYRQCRWEVPRCVRRGETGRSRAFTAKRSGRPIGQIGGRCRRSAHSGRGADTRTPPGRQRRQAARCRLHKLVSLTPARIAPGPPIGVIRSVVMAIRVESLGFGRWPSPRQSQHPRDVHHRCSEHPTTPTLPGLARRGATTNVCDPRSLASRARPLPESSNRR
jgi:hypothetical protein